MKKAIDYRDVIVIDWWLAFICKKDNSSKVRSISRLIVTSTFTSFTPLQLPPPPAFSWSTDLLDSGKGSEAVGIVQLGNILFGKMLQRQTKRRGSVRSISQLPSRVWFRDLVNFIWNTKRKLKGLSVFSLKKIINTTIRRSRLSRSIIRLICKIFSR